MKKLLLFLILISFSTLSAFAQSDDISKQMEQMHKEMREMMEQLSQNFNGQSFFFSDTLMMGGMEDLQKLLEQNGAILMDTILIPNMEEGWMRFGEQLGNAESLEEMMKEFQKQLHEMPAEDWENLSKMFEDFGMQFYNPFETSPENGEKKGGKTKPGDKKNKKRKTYTL